MARICLITPGHLSTNPRIVKEADALLEAGHDVRVIACDFAAWPREADTEFADRSWRGGEKLSFGPQAPLYQRLKQLVRQRLARLLFRFGLRGEKIESAAFHSVAPDLANAARREPADLYVAHYVAALPAAAQAAAQHNALYAFDAEDFHLGDLPDAPEYVFEKSLICAIETRYLRKCAYITAASPGIADAYAKAYRIKRPSVVLNVFPRSHAVAAPTVRGFASHSPSIYWFSQTIGPKRGLECAVRAISRAKSKPHIYLRGNITEEFRAVLDTLAEDERVRDMVHVLPPARPNEMVRLAAGYDLALVGETGETQNRRIALTNKQFTCLLAGVPVLMSDVPAHREFATDLTDVVRLYTVGNADDLAAAMDAWLMDENALAVARKSAWIMGQQKFNWEVEKLRFLACINSLNLTSPEHAFKKCLDS